MKHTPIRLAAVLALCAAAHAVSTYEHAEAAPQEDPEPQPAAASEVDAYARGVVEFAAWRQGGAELLEESALQSAHIDFARVSIRRRQQQADGTVKNEKIDADALEIDWMAHADAEDSLRTRWKINGQETVRAVYGPRQFYWLHDGEKMTPISKAKNPDDWQEIDRDRRLSRALLHVGLLGKLLRDGSDWRTVDDPTYPGVALYRKPPATDPNPISFTVWFDPKDDKWDPIAVRVDPIEAGASYLFYELQFHPEYPLVSGATGPLERAPKGKMRFPFRVTVKEQRPEDSKPIEMLELALRSVSFNSVKQTIFSPKSIEKPR